VVTRELRKAGKSAEFVARRLNKQFRLAADVTARMLRQAGWNLQQVANAVAKVYGDTAKGGAALVKGLKQAGGDAVSVAKAAKRAFAKTTTGKSLAVSLRRAGYKAVQVARGLVSVYGKKRSQIASYMRAAGYTQKQYNAAIKAIIGNVDSGVRSGPRLALVEPYIQSPRDSDIPVKLEGPRARSPGVGQAFGDLKAAA
jgi:ATP-dependent Clp protease ATP-binding subunit ClpA